MTFAGHKRETARRESGNALLVLNYKKDVPVKCVRPVARISLGRAGTRNYFFRLVRRRWATGDLSFVAGRIDRYGSFQKIVSCPHFSLRRAVKRLGNRPCRPEPYFSNCSLIRSAIRLYRSLPSWMFPGRVSRRKPIEGQSSQDRMYHRVLS